MLPSLPRCDLFLLYQPSQQIANQPTRRALIRPGQTRWHHRGRRKTCTCVRTLLCGVSVLVSSFACGLINQKGPTPEETVLGDGRCALRMTMLLVGGPELFDFGLRGGRLDFKGKLMTKQ